VPVPRRFDRRPPERDTTRINDRIRVPKVRLIGADGEQLGIVATNEALKRAQEADLDLVEVAPNSKPPVTRLLDYSKYKYEQEQKQKAARKHQQQVNVREIKLRPKIASHDYETKKGHVERFLRQQNKVKVTIMFRGREQAHPERGRALLQRLFEDLNGLAVIESEPLKEGRNMSMMLAPSKEVARAAKAAQSDEDAAGAEDAAKAAEAAEDTKPDEAAKVDKVDEVDEADEADEDTKPDEVAKVDEAAKPDEGDEDTKPDEAAKVDEVDEVDEADEAAEGDEDTKPDEG
jgi:translation initiation factor IF-3